MRKNNSELLINLNNMLGKKLSSTMNAYGYTLYLELGEVEIKEESTPGGNLFKTEKGEITFVIDGNWRFLQNSEVVINSTSDTRKTINVFLNDLIGANIIAVSIGDQNFETKITFDNGIKLVVIPASEDSRVWAIKDRENDIWFEFNLEKQDRELLDTY